MHITHAHRWKLQLEWKWLQWRSMEWKWWRGLEWTDLENGSDDTSNIPEAIQADATPQSVLAKWLLVFILCLQSIFLLSDSVVGYLIKFMKTFFRVVGRFCTACAEIAVVFPSSLYRVRKACHIDDLKFKRNVVCRKCHYTFWRTVSVVQASLEEAQSVLTRLIQIIHIVECGLNVGLLSVKLLS